MRKNIGLWLPSRKEYWRTEKEKDAFFLKEIKDLIIDNLSKLNVKIIDDLNIKNAIIKSGKVYINDTCLNNLDLFFWFGKLEYERTLDDKYSRYWIDVLRTINKDVPVVNPINWFEVAIDKFKTQSLLHDNGVLVPPFTLTPKREQLKNLIDEWKEVLIKPRYGGAGTAIIRLKDYYSLRDTLAYSNRGIHFMERFIPYSTKNYTGINIINNKFIHGYTKKNEVIEDKWKVTGKKPGMMVFKEVEEKEKKIALKVAKIIKLDLLAVDMITGYDGKTYVVDVNAFPGIYPEVIAKSKNDPVEELINCVKNKLSL